MFSPTLPRMSRVTLDVVTRYEHHAKHWGGYIPRLEEGLVPVKDVRNVSFLSFVGFMSHLGVLAGALGVTG